MTRWICWICRTREIHAKDGSSYVEGERGRWTVTYRWKQVPGAFRTREAARRCIREMKATKESP